MRNLFFLLVLASLAYIAVLVATSQPRIRSMFRRQLNPNRLADRLQSEVLQEILRQSGVQISAKRFNLFRIVLILLVILVGYGTSFFQNEKPTMLPLLLAFVVWFATSPHRHTLGGLIFSRLQKRQYNKKNGELISFLKLYEHNKRLQNLNFEHFVKRISPHFSLIHKELVILSERVTDDGLQDALEWFVRQFPKDHPFVGQIRTIILATEGVDGEEVVKYLDEESKTIARISNDLYLSRWNTISAFATLINALPSLAMFFLVILLVLYNISIVKNPF